MYLVGSSGDNQFDFLWHAVVVAAALLHWQAPWLV
jgi:hypothetical protein